MKFDKEKAIDLVAALCKKYKIQIVKTRITASGRAFIKAKQIEVPQPVNIERLCVCLHEIGHIVVGNISPKFIAEFKCESFAMQTAKDAGFNPEDYAENARGYVMAKIAQAHNRGLSIAKVPQEVIDFIGPDYWEQIKNGWGGKFFVHRARKKYDNHRIEIYQ